MEEEEYHEFIRKSLLSIFQLDGRVQYLFGGFSDIDLFDSMNCLWGGNKMKTMMKTMMMKEKEKETKNGEVAEK